ncbi:MAG: uroporphyrinogen decarboxylase family protein [Armatimonadota bacterium]
MNDKLTSRQRVQRVLKGDLPDRMPFNFWMDRDKMTEYDAKWGADFRLTHYGVDVIEAFIALPFWAQLEAKTVNDGKTVWQTEPLVDSMKDAIDLAMPDPTNPKVYSDIAAKRAANPDKAIFAMMIAPLGILEPLRLAENLFLDLYDSADEIHSILGSVRPVMMEAARRACEMDIDVLYLAADICSRDGAMVSPSQLREFNFDYIRDVIDIAHEAGKKVFYHSDGLILPVLDIYVEYGIDGCNPLEPRYNDAREFADRFGDKLMLYGGGDNCCVIPDGTADEVREHVRNRFDILGKNGRFIFSTHDIPGHCPQKNLDAMVDSIKECRY